MPIAAPTAPATAPVAAPATGVAADIRRHIAAAADATGVDFRYLVGQAQVESSMNPRARAATSSASGLYQFVEQTWLATLHRHGAEHGLGWASERIAQGPDGRFRVADGAARQPILALRDDPRVAALMAGEFASDNRAIVEGATGRTATATDLYLAHFLGPAGAARFLVAAASDPDASAAALFPQAAAANRGVFTDGGRPLSLGAVHRRLDARLARGMAAAGQSGGATADALTAPSFDAPTDARTEWQLAARAARPRLAAAPAGPDPTPRDSTELARLLMTAIAS